MSERTRALITGITGQDGSYLAEFLLEKGYEVHGLVRRASTESFQRLSRIRDRITLHSGDLLDQRSLVDVLRESEPDEVYNLAAMSFVAASWTQPTLTAEFTGVGVTRMLEALREVCPRGPLLSGVLERDVRQGPRGAAERAHAVLSAQPLRGREGLRPLHHRQLPRELRPLRLLGDSLQPRVARAAGSSSSPARSPTAPRRSSSAARASSRWGTWTRARDWGYAIEYVEAMWLMLQRDEPERLRRRHRHRPLGQGPGRDRLRPRRARSRPSM